MQAAREFSRKYKNIYLISWAEFSNVVIETHFIPMTFVSRQVSISGPLKRMKLQGLLKLWGAKVFQNVPHCRNEVIVKMLNSHQILLNYEKNYSRMSDAYVSFLRSCVTGNKKRQSCSDQ